MAKAKKNLIEVVIPFQSDKFREAWEIWKQYRLAEHKFKFKSPYSEQARLNSLYRMAKGDVDWAIEIMEQSMANGWEGLFQLPLKSNGERDSTKRAKPTGGIASRQYKSLNSTGQQLHLKIKELVTGTATGSERPSIGGSLEYDG